MGMHQPRAVKCSRRWGTHRAGSSGDHPSMLPALLLLPHSHLPSIPGRIPGPAPKTHSHFPMCFSLSLNKASSDTAPPASLGAEGAASPGRQPSGHCSVCAARGIRRDHRCDPIPALPRAEPSESRQGEGTGTPGMALEGDPWWM